MWGYTSSHTCFHWIFQSIMIFGLILDFRWMNGIAARHEASLYGRKDTQFELWQEGYSI